MQYLHKIAYLLLIVGGLNWLVFGVIGWDIGQLLGGMDTIVSRIVYILVGIAALYSLFEHRKMCKDCESKSAAM